MTNYRNPPIREALIDLKIDYEYDDSKINLLINELKDDFPLVQDMIFNDFAISVDKQQESETAKKNHVAKKLLSEDNKNIIQILPENIIYSRLAPYESWEHFIGLFNRLKTSFQRYFTLDISRVGVRYINNFNCTIEDFEKYIHIKPKIGLRRQGYSVSRAMQRFELQYANLQSIINSIVDPILVNGTTQLNITLDIDVFKVFHEPCNLDGLGIILPDIRILKNNLFVESIDQVLREKLYGPCY